MLLSEPPTGRRLVPDGIDFQKVFQGVLKIDTADIPRKNPLEGMQAVKNNLDNKTLGFFILYGTLSDWAHFANTDDAPLKWQELLDDNLFPYFRDPDTFELPTIQDANFKIIRDYVIQRLKPDVKLAIRRADAIKTNILNKL